ncbi:MAG: response regulator [Coriobacteriia bacterium]|nr:response regulator [Coriobacteriia bacterium]
MLSAAAGESTGTGTSTSSQGAHLKQRLRLKLLGLNARRMLIFCLLYIVVHSTTFFLSNSIEGKVLFGVTQPFSWIHPADTAVAIVALCLGASFAILFVCVFKGVIKRPKTQSDLVHACLVLLTFVQLLLYPQELGTNYFLLYFMIYVLMLGVLPILNRVQSLGYILGFALLSWIIYVATFPSILEVDLAAITSSSAPANIVLLQSTISFYAIVLVAFAVSLAVSRLSHRLIVQNIMLKLELEERKIELESCIEEQTAQYKEKARVAEASSLAKTRFFTKASHEMRSSMTAILGMVFFAKESGDIQTKQESLESIDRETQKLKGIVGSIIEGTYDEAGSPTKEHSKDASAGAEPLPAKEAHKPLDAPLLSGHNLLVVEDLDTNRFVLTEYLKKTQANVEEAINGKEAVERFAASPEGYYSFVFMDLLMPEMNGHEATRAIRSMERRDAADVPIVAVSANAFKEDIEASLAAGMDAHLAKPVEQSTVFRVLIERLL